MPCRGLLLKKFLECIKTFDLIDHNSNSLNEYWIGLNKRFENILQLLNSLHNKVERLIESQVLILKHNECLLLQSCMQTKALQTTFSRIFKSSKSELCKASYLDTSLTLLMTRRDITAPGPQWGHLARGRRHRGVATWGGQLRTPAEAITLMTSIIRIILTTVKINHSLRAEIMSKQAIL